MNSGHETAAGRFVVILTLLLTSTHFSGCATTSDEGRTDGVPARIINTETGKEIPATIVPMADLPCDVEVRDVSTGKVMSMRLEPLASLEQLGAVTIGKGRNATTVWVAEHTIEITGSVPPPGWNEIYLRATENEIKKLLGRPGRIQQAFAVTVWWYRYSDSSKKYVAFRDGKAFEMR